MGALESGGRNVYEAAKAVIKSPANVDWKKQGPVGGVVDATRNAALTTVGETLMLGGKGAGFVLGRARDMAFRSIKNVVGIGIGLAKNVPLPMPGGPANFFDVQKSLGARALNDKINNGTLWKKTPDSPPASSPGPDAAKI